MTTTIPRPPARESAVTCGHVFTEGAGADLAGLRCPVPTWHPSGFCPFHREPVALVERRSGSRVHRPALAVVYREHASHDAPPATFPNGRPIPTTRGVLR